MSASATKVHTPNKTDEVQRLAKVARILRKCQADCRKDGEHAGLRSYCKMCQSDCGEVALDHEQQANRSRLNGFMPAEHQPVLVFLMKEVTQFHQSPLGSFDQDRQSLWNRLQFSRA